VKKQIYTCLGLVLLSLTPAFAASKTASSTAKSLAFQGWIDFEQDTNGTKKPQFNTDFQLDTSALNPNDLTRYATDKVIINGDFITQRDGTILFKVKSLSPAPNEQDSSGIDPVDSSDVDLNDDPHN